MVKVKSPKVFKVKTRMNEKVTVLALADGIVRNKQEALINVLLQIFANLFDEGARRVMVKYLPDAIIIWGVGGEGFTEKDIANFNAIGCSDKNTGTDGKGEEKHGMYGLGKIAAVRLWSEVLYTSCGRTLLQGNTNEVIELKLTADILEKVCAAGNTDKNELEFQTISKSAEIKKFIPEFGTVIQCRGNSPLFEFPKTGDTVARYVAQRVAVSQLSSIIINDKELTIPKEIDKEKVVKIERYTHPKLGYVEATIATATNASDELLLGGKWAQVSMRQFARYLSDTQIKKIAPLIYSPLVGIISIEAMNKFRSHESSGTLKVETSNSELIPVIVSELYKMTRMVEQRLLQKTISYSDKDHKLQKTLIGNLQKVFGEVGEATVVSGKSGSRDFTLSPANFILAAGEKAEMKIISPDNEYVDMVNVDNSGYEAARINIDKVEITAKDKPGKYMLGFQEGDRVINAHITVVDEKIPYLSPMEAHIGADGKAIFTVKHLPADAEIKWMVEGLEQDPRFVKTDISFGKVSFQPIEGVSEGQYEITCVVNGQELTSTIFIDPREDKTLNLVKIDETYYNVTTYGLPDYNSVAYVDDENVLCRLGKNVIPTQTLKVNIGHPLLTESEMHLDEVYNCLFGAIIKKRAAEGEFADSVQALDAEQKMRIHFKMRLLGKEGLES